MKPLSLANMYQLIVLYHSGDGSDDKQLTDPKTWDKKTLFQLSSMF